MLRPDKSWVVGSTEVSGFRVWRPGEHIKYLGYSVGGDGMERQISKMTGALNKWRWRSLSMLGRVNVMNSYGLSMLTYHMCIHPYTKEVSKSIAQITRWFLFSGNDKMDLNRRYASQMAGSKLVAMGLMDWGAQWKALRAVTMLKAVRDTGSKVGEVARRRLEEMRGRRGWLVSPVWAYNTRWSRADKQGVLGEWLAEAGEVGIHPLHSFQIGDMACTWSMKNRLGYEGIVLKLQQKDKYNEHDMVKVRDTQGRGEWWPQHWLVKRGTEWDWAGQEIANEAGLRLVLEKEGDGQREAGSGVGAVKTLRRGLQKQGTGLRKEVELGTVKKERVLNTKLLSFLYRYLWGGLWLLYRERVDKMCLCCGEADETRKHRFKGCIWNDWIRQEWERWWREERGIGVAGTGRLWRNGQLVWEEVAWRWVVWRGRCLVVHGEWDGVSQLTLREVIKNTVLEQEEWMKE